MTTPAYSIVYSATVSGTTGAVNVGSVMIPSASSPTTYVVATTANRGTRRSEGVALTAYGASGTGAVEIQQSGTIDATTSGLAAGAASWVRCSTTGTIERCTPAPGDDIIGYAEVDGRVHLCFGFLTSSITSGGGGGSTPTGTGFRHVTGGVEDAAAALVVNADVNASAAIAVTKLATGSNNGEVLMRTAGANAFGLVANANVDAAAAIAGTKVSPNFGAQLVQTTGDLSCGGANVASAGMIRGANAVWYAVRNAGNTADLQMMRASNVDNLEVWGTGAAYGDNIQNAPSGQRHIFQDQLVYRMILRNASVSMCQPVKGDGALASSPFRWAELAIAQASTVTTTLSTSQYECPRLIATGTPGGNFAWEAPATAGAFYIVTNTTPNTLTFRKNGGTGVAIATTKTAIIAYDATAADYRRITLDA